MYMVKACNTFIFEIIMKWALFKASSAALNRSTVIRLLSPKCPWIWRASILTVAAKHIQRINATSASVILKPAGLISQNLPWWKNDGLWIMSARGSTALKYCWYKTSASNLVGKTLVWQVWRGEAREEEIRGWFERTGFCHAGITASGFSSWRNWLCLVMRILVAAFNYGELAWYRGLERVTSRAEREIPWQVLWAGGLTTPYLWNHTRSEKPTIRSEMLSLPIRIMP